MELPFFYRPFLRPILLPTPTASAAAADSPSHKLIKEGLAGPLPETAAIACSFERSMRAPMQQIESDVVVSADATTFLARPGVFSQCW